MNKVEDLSRQVCQQVIVKTEGTKWMQPRMNAIQESTAISKKTTQKVKGRTQFPRKNEQLRLRSMEVKLKGAETKLEPILVYIMKDFAHGILESLKYLESILMC